MKFSYKTIIPADVGGLIAQFEFGTNPRCCEALRRGGIKSAGVDTGVGVC
jgi:hypothetical protein